MLALPTTAVLWALLSWVTAAASRRLVAASAYLPPWHRSWVLLFLSVLPPVLTVLVLAALFVPGLNTLTMDAHCHGGACEGHTPSLPAEGARAAWVMALVVGFPFAGALALTLAAIWRSTKMASLLAGLSHADAAEHRTLESEAVMAMCVGIVKPVVVVSSGLKALASPGMLNIVLLHEHAHALRFDNLRMLLASVATFTWPTGARRNLLDALSLSAEEACDAAVVQAGHTPAAVAAAIREMATATASEQPDAETKAQAARIEALGRRSWSAAGESVVASGLNGSLRWLAAGGVMLVVLSAVGGARLLHHGAEHLLGAG